LQKWDRLLNESEAILFTETFIIMTLRETWAPVTAIDVKTDNSPSIRHQTTVSAIPPVSPEIVRGSNTDLMNVRTHNLHLRKNKTEISHLITLYFRKTRLKLQDIDF
jgi:hypothetical protein